MSIEKDNIIEKLNADLQRAEELYESDRYDSSKQVQQLQAQLQDYSSQVCILAERCEDYEQNVVARYKLQVAELTNRVQELEES